MKRFNAVLLAALLLLCLPSCGMEETPVPASAVSAENADTPTTEINADTPALTAGCEEFDGVFSPFFAQTDADRDAVELTQLRLLPNDRSGLIVLRGIEGETIPYHGTEYTYYGPADLTIAEQTDGTVWYDVTLRDDLCFSDGTALTVDDLIFSLYVLCDSDYDGPSQLSVLPIQGLDDYHGGDEENISGIVKTGNYSLRLVLEQVDQRTLYTLSEICIAPLHYYGDAAAYHYERNQFGFPKGDLAAVRAKNDAPLGAGMYQFVSYIQGEITYTANTRYYRGSPVTEVLRLRGLSQQEQGAWPDMVRTGELSVSCFSSSYGRMDDEFEQAVGDSLTRQLVSDADGANYEYIGIDPERVCVAGEPDSEASRALRRGLTVVLSACRIAGLEQAAELGLDNFYVLVDAPISAVTWLAKENNGETDLSAAKQIALDCFVQAGYTVEGGQVTGSAEGATCRFEVRARAYPDGEDGQTVCDPTYLTLLEAKNALSELGIQLDVVNTYGTENPFPVYGGSDLWAGVWSQLDLAGCSQIYGMRPDLYSLVDPGIQLNAVYGSNGGYNRYGFADPELDTLLQSADTAADPNVRKALYQDCLTRVEGWAVEVPLYQSQGAVVFHNEKIDAETFPTELTACYSWMQEADRIRLK